jgi:hypothetical protein
MKTGSSGRHVSRFFSFLPGNAGNSFKSGHDHFSHIFFNQGMKNPIIQLDTEWATDIVIK